MEDSLEQCNIELGPMYWEITEVYCNLLTLYYGAYLIFSVIDKKSYFVQIFDILKMGLHIFFKGNFTTSEHFICK